jgi:hypothetical protein
MFAFTPAPHGKNLTIISLQNRLVTNGDYRAIGSKNFRVAPIPLWQHSSENSWGTDK